MESLWTQTISKSQTLTFHKALGQRIWGVVINKSNRNNKTSKAFTFTSSRSFHPMIRII